jgi:DNA replication protein DnaC
MKHPMKDINEMLDILELPLVSQRLNEIVKSPQLSNYSPIQLVREILQDQYLEKKNKIFENNLRLSAVLDRSARIENLKTGNGRVYNDSTVEQILSFSFVEDRQNVGVYGVTEAGKSYFLAACCVEACRRDIRCRFIDYSELLDELTAMKRLDLTKYNKRIKFYSRIQLMFIDDFAINRYPEETVNILYHLIKMRTDRGTSTMFSCQYSPDEWSKVIGDDTSCYGKLDGIRRRLINGYTVLIEKSK